MTSRKLTRLHNTTQLVYRL